MNKSTKMGKVWIGAALTAMALVCVQPALAQIGVVSVTGGRVEGVTADGITSFKGIPFAAPPVGNLRWRVPQPVRPWTGIRKADKFGPECMQRTFHRPGVQPPAVSEDCLYLNVWTGAKSAHARLPVMVWIYGGAFTGGSGSVPAYDGTFFAQKGVVLVNLNYRLGVFGFLADRQLDAESPHHVSGNYGLDDMIAALKWVRANIAHFGGDPSRVTIFGESAGGLSVGILAASPAAKGLFQRAISESGGAPITPAGLGGAGYSIAAVAAYPSLASAEAMGQRFLAKLGARDLAAARALPAKTLLKAQPADISPVYDGYILPGDAYQRLHEGRFNHTPILVGTNSNEGGFRPFQAEFVGTTPQKFEAHIRAAYGKYADAILAAYPHATPAQAEQSSDDLFFRDAGLAWRTWAWARAQAKMGHDKTYMYYFDRRTPKEPLGPVHTGEIAYVFGSVAHGVARGFGPPGPVSPTDMALSKQMQSYWVNFAKAGNPNGPGLPHWPAFSASSPRVMYLDAHSHAGPVPNLHKLKVLDAFFNWLRKENKENGK